MVCYLARIDSFPVKSLDGVSVTTATVLGSGALAGDRTYALFDRQGRFINGKRNAAIHRLRATFSADRQALTLDFEGNTPPATFHLRHQRLGLEAWLSDYFQQPVTLGENSDTGFPDDMNAVGPTVISTATLQAVADWYDLTLDQTRRRFRTNLEIGGVPAFWEDQLFGADSPVRFAIGDVVLEGINPCQRCIVPTRDGLTGMTTTPNFQKTFSQQRAATLPAWAPPQRFNHFYKVAVNTKISGQTGQTLTVGDGVRLM